MGPGDCGIDVKMISLIYFKPEESLMTSRRIRLTALMAFALSAFVSAPLGASRGFGEDFRNDKELPQLCSRDGSHLGRISKVDRPGAIEADVDNIR